MAGTLVLGLGNILLRDEGLGVRVIERLRERYRVPAGVEIVDGGTLGLDLLPYVQDATRMLLVDSCQAGEAPGTLVRLAGQEIPVFLDAARVSPHQDGLHDLLAAARLTRCLPAEVVMWGAQVESLGVGVELSPAIAAQVDPLVDKLVAELTAWGIDLPATG